MWLKFMVCLCYVVFFRVNISGTFRKVMGVFFIPQWPWNPSMALDRAKSSDSLISVFSSCMNLNVADSVPISDGDLWNKVFFWSGIYLFGHFFRPLSCSDAFHSCKKTLFWTILTMIIDGFSSWVVGVGQISFVFEFMYLDLNLSLS